MIGSDWGESDLRLESLRRLLEEVTFKLALNRFQGPCLIKIWEECSARGNSKCKGPEAGRGLEDSRKSVEMSS